MSQNRLKRGENVQEQTKEDIYPKTPQKGTSSKQKRGILVSPFAGGASAAGFTTPRQKVMINENQDSAIIDGGLMKEFKRLVSLKKEGNSVGLRKGRLAPNFSVQTIDGSSYSLGQLRGQNVILFFFPFCFEEITTKELIELSTVQNNKYFIICISQDSQYAVREFLSTTKCLNNTYFDPNKLVFVSDVSADLRKLYALVLSGNGSPELDWNKAIRANYLIDKDGIITDFQFGEINQSRNINNLLAFYDTLLPSTSSNYQQEYQSNLSL